MILKGTAIVYGVSFVARLVLTFDDITPQSNPNVYPLLELVIGAIGTALALRAAHATRLSYLVGIGMSLWLFSGTSVFVGAQTVTSWLFSSIFVAITIILGRFLLETVLETPQSLDLSLEGIIRERNSGLLGHRAGRSFF